MNEIKEDFLIIPDAPNYEINSQLLVRNKKTGRILKPRQKQLRIIVAFQAANGKRQSRDIQSLRNQAISAVKTDVWFSVPSLGNLYEINKKGQLRNARTKRNLKINRDKNFLVWFNNKTLRVTLKSLMWEVFGKFTKSYRPPYIPVIIAKGAIRRRFTSLRSTSKFLSSIIYLSDVHIRKLLSKRIAEIDGWKITYYPPKDLSTVTDTAQQWIGKPRKKKASD